MAFTVEDGTVVADANAYITVAYATTYHDDRANTAWATATTATQQAAIIKATDYIEANFLFTTGGVVDTDQTLQWPRWGAIDRNGNLFDTNEVPGVVKQATAILALEVVNGTALNEGTGRKTKKEKAGPVEVEYSDGSATRTIYWQIYGLLQGLVAARGMGRIARG